MQATHIIVLVPDIGSCCCISVNIRGDIWFRVV